MTVNQLIEISKDAGKDFYVGKDSEGWNKIVIIIDSINKLGNKVSGRIIKDIIREISFIENFKGIKNYPLIGDSLYHKIPEILRDVEKGDI